MTRLLLALAALALLAACQPAPRAADDVPQARKIVRFASGGAVYKACDQGRAIYASKHNSSGGLAVVENAPECA